MIRTMDSCCENIFLLWMISGDEVQILGFKPLLEPKHSGILLANSSVIKLYRMKKILFLILICGAAITASAQSTDSTTTTTTTTTSHKYYYYPSSNVYFDEASGNYWYWNGASSDWSMVQSLPDTVKIEKTTTRYPITYSGNDPWKNNAEDLKKYKVKKNGAVKIKPKS